MPQLRSAVRRGRQKPIAYNAPPHAPSPNNEPHALPIRRGRKKKNDVQPIAPNAPLHAPPKRRGRKKQNDVVHAVAVENDVVVKKTVSSQRTGEEEKESEEMDEYESGGGSGNKALGGGAEDEGNTPPLPERVRDSMNS